MPAMLLSVIFSKYTWMAIGAAALAGFLYFGVYRPYENMKAQAALVPALQAANTDLAAQAKDTEHRISQVNVDLGIARAQRDQAVSDLGVWTAAKGKLFTALTRMSQNAPATLNPICLPSAAERELWNATLASLTSGNAGAGPTGAPGKVPNGAPGVH